MNEKAAITLAMQSKPSIKERQRALREEAILDSAVKLISERGFASVTFEQIADEACVSKPTLYQHFRSKDEIAARLSIRCLCMARDRILAVPSDLPADERLRQTLRTVVEFRLDEKLSLYVDLAQKVLPIRHDNLEIKAIEEELGGMLESMLVQAQEMGSVRRDLSVQFLRRILFSIFKDETYITPQAMMETANQFADEVFTLLGMPKSS
ncbi:MAG: helix-turn-helix domain containing protein [Fimbriimonas sp.]|nr:helix-turn-helix domain containing protein [Fimbriimonas sp.]